MRIFISHATEDKANFVRPLAEALKQHFDIWYDEYELTVGDSLVKKINEGLSACDYGVVVLSSSFFQKKWPQAELDGLFALEGTSRKVILPVWKDVSEDDIRKFSPLLAGRLGVSASKGIECVVSEIRRAVEVSNRTREITVTESVIEKAKLIDQTLQERSINQRLSRCEEGVAIVSTGFTRFCDATKTCINDICRNSQVLKFDVKQTSHCLGPLFIVQTNYALALHVLLSGLGGNYTYETELSAIVFKRRITDFNQEEPASRIRELKFKPIFRLQNQLGWSETSRKTYTTEELASLLLKTLIDEVQRQART
jgi:hypothetical protein